MSKLKHPFGRDDEGNHIPAQDGIPGKVYNCWGCKTAKLRLLSPINRVAHYKKVIGTTHTGPVCKNLENDTVKSVKLIDVKRICKNAINVNKTKRDDTG